MNLSTRTVCASWDGDKPYAWKWSQVSDNEFRQQVCISDEDGVIHATVPPCAEGAKLVNAELSGLAVLAAQVMDSELPYNLAQTRRNGHSNLAQRSASLVEANLNTLF